MLKELKFVQGAVAKKDLLPALTHFRIEGGFVRGYNGTIALCSPIPFDIDCTPKAEPLVKAIQNCNETVQLSMTPAGRLSIKSGSFKAFIDCVEGETPHVEPDGEPIEVDGAALLGALKSLAPFVGEDASRPWANGVLLSGQSAFATNNIILVEYWVGVNFPHMVNVPRMAIKEMLRINEPPIRAQMTDKSLTFHYTDGRWVRTQLLDVGWPDVRKILDRPSTQRPVDTRIFEGLKVLKPFADKMGRVLFTGEGIRTHQDDAEGATYDIDKFGYEGVYALQMLDLLNGVANTVDFTAYPDPCIFHGDRMRGAIIGMLL